MSQGRKTSALFIVFILTLLKFSAVNAEEVKLTVGWTEWPPYKTAAKGKLTGLDIELVNAIFKEAGFKTEYVNIPWMRNLMMVEAGRMDIVTSALKTEEREAYAYFSDPYRKEEAILYVQKGKVSHWDLRKLEDIQNSGFRLGITRGYSYGEKFDNLMESPEFRKNIEIVNIEIQNFRKLELGRIDGLINEVFATPPILENDDLVDSVEPYPLTVYSKNVHVMFSKASTKPQWVNRFNQALKRLNERGVLEAIENKYR